MDGNEGLLKLGIRSTLNSKSAAPGLPPASFSSLVFTLFLLSPLDIYLFTWEWSRKTQLLQVHGWESHTEAGLPVLCPQARLLSPTMNPVWKGWEDKWGWWRAYRFSEMDDSLWAGKTTQSNLQSRQTTHFLLCPLCTLHQMFYGIKPDPGRPVAPFCTPRASYQHVYHNPMW